MLLLINLGKRGGSGVPKIRSGWEQAGHSLRLSDSFEPFAGQSATGQPNQGGRWDVLG